MVVISDNRSSEELKTSVAQVQVNYQTKEWYMIANVLKYRSDNLIILLLYIFWVIGYYRGCYLELYKI